MPAARWQKPTCLTRGLVPLCAVCQAKSQGVCDLTWPVTSPTLGSSGASPACLCSMPRLRASTLGPGGRVRQLPDTQRCVSRLTGSLNLRAALTFLCVSRAQVAACQAPCPNRPCFCVRGYPKGKAGQQGNAGQSPVPAARCVNVHVLHHRKRPAEAAWRVSLSDCMEMTARSQ